MARFAVIIPLFNKAPYVKKALRSVFDQTFEDWELVVVDDGSVDGSGDIAHQCIEDFSGSSKCRLIRQENAGVGAARNIGVAASSGEYLCFLDADDWWDERFLERMNGLIEKYPGAGIYGTSYFLVKNGRRKVAPIALDEGFEKGYINYLEVYSRYLCQPLWTGAVSMSRGVFEEMGGFKTGLKLGEDFDLWVRIVLRYRVAFLNEPLSFYNQDVELKNRATRRLHRPEHHFIFNMGYFEPVEAENADYKRLIDKLRVDALLGYRMSPEYREVAEKELAKVDWNCQDSQFRGLYKMPSIYLRFRQTVLVLGSRIKQRIIQLNVKLLF